MSEIYILIEHRQDEIRDISYELLACGRKLAEENNSKVTAVILGFNTEKIVEKIESQAHKVLVIDNEVFKDFNSETYQMALTDLIQKDNPFLFLMGHTAFGMDLCPALGTQLNIPFTTDCLDVEIFENNLRVVRHMFDGKLAAKLLLRIFG